MSWWCWRVDSPLARSGVAPCGSVPSGWCHPCHPPPPAPKGADPTLGTVHHPCTSHGDDVGSRERRKQEEEEEEKEREEEEGAQRVVRGGMKAPNPDAAARDVGAGGAGAGAELPGRR